MNRTEELDRLYGLLVALGESRHEAPEPDLMDAFNVVSERHQPSAFPHLADQDYDAQLAAAHTLLLHLAETAHVLGEALDMYDAAELVRSVIDGRRRS